MKFLFIAGLCAFSVSGLALAQTPSSKKQVILHADDLGMAHVMDLASFAALEQGVVSSASFMPPTPWMPEIVAYAKAHPAVDLGVHITLNSEWPGYRWRSVSDPSLVASLLDLTGYFWPEPVSLLTHAKPAEAEIEMRSQVQRTIDLGIKPTHIDTHMGSALLHPAVLQAYFKVSREFNLPAMLIRWSPELEKLLESRGLPVDVYKALYKQLELDKYAWIDRVITLTYDIAATTPEQVSQSYEQVLRSLPDGTSLLIVHLSSPNDPESRAVQALKLGELDRRAQDAIYFSDQKTRELIKTLGIELISWKQLAAQHSGN